MERIPPIENDPLQFASQLGFTVKNAGVLENVRGFLKLVSFSLDQLNGRLMIETLAGEMTDIIEWLRWDCLDVRSELVVGVDPSKFPRVYDRIHMSNIP